MLYVQVLMNTRESVTIFTGETTKIEKFKKLVERHCNVKPEDQILFFAGKQLENQHTLCDYGIDVADEVQLMIRTVIEEQKPLQNITDKLSTQNATSSSDKDVLDDDVLLESKYFKIGDNVDVKDYHYGSWFIAKLINIKKDTSPSVDKPNNPQSPVVNDGLIYVCEFYGYPEEPPTEVQLQYIRPHAYEIIPFNKLKIGDQVLMNYNVDYPQERGNWYDVLVKNIRTRRGNRLIGDINVGMDGDILHNCTLKFYDDIYKIQPYKLVSKRTLKDNKIMQTQPVAIRAGPLQCITCKDDTNKLCKECSCCICGLKDNTDKQLICDECNNLYHMYCLVPPLKEIPIGDWYCATCKKDDKIVKAVKELKKTETSQKRKTFLSEYYNLNENQGKKGKMLYKLEEKEENLIAADKVNKIYWDDCMTLLDKGRNAFLRRVEEVFSCICCEQMVLNPITTSCSHNICKECLQRSFSANVYQCPSCHSELGNDIKKIKENDELFNILMYFFPTLPLLRFLN